MRMPEYENNTEGGVTLSAASPNKGAVRDIALLALGFGCMIGFARMCSLGFVGYLSYEVSSMLDPWYIMRSAVEVSVLVLLALAGRNRWFAIDIKSFSAATVCGIAAAIVFAVDADGVLGLLVAVLGGIAMAVLMYAWILLLASRALPEIVASALFGLALSALIVQGTPLIGVDLALIVAVVSAFVAGAVPVKFDSDFTFCEADGPLATDGVRQLPLLTIVMVVACGFFATVLYGVAEYLTWLYDWEPNYLVFGFAAIGVIVATVATMARSRTWMQIVWAPLFALFALAVAFSCLPASNMMQIAVGLMMATVFGSHFLYWMVFPSLLSSLKVPRSMFAGVLLVLSNSSLASLAGDALGSVLPRSMQNLGSVSGLMAIAVAAVFAIALVVNRQQFGARGTWSPAADAPEPAADAIELVANTAEPAEPEKPAEPEAKNPTDLLKERLDAFVEQYGLTPRETEVALYTVQGFSCAYIAEKLVVSNSTVRFHQQNIYRKFEVHSRNELIELVSEE